MNMKIIPLTITLVATACGIAGISQAEEKTYHDVHRGGAFMIAHNRFTGCAIGVDTTNPDMLKLAIELQNKLYSLSGARLPIEYVVSGVKPGRKEMRFQMIYFTQKKLSTGEEAAYTLSWEFHQPGYSINCRKRIRIEYSSLRDARDAIEFILKKEWGTNLKVEEKVDEEFKKMLYIPVTIPEKSLEIVAKPIATTEKPQ
jgi:hypothetical protein